MKASTKHNSYWGVSRSYENIWNITKMDGYVYVLDHHVYFFLKVVCSDIQITDYIFAV